MYSTQNTIRDKSLNEGHRLDYCSDHAPLHSLRQNGVNALYSSSPNLHGDNLLPIRQQLREYFIATFERYESLFETLASDDAYYKKPIELRHPLIFYLGHTATFFVNKMLLTHLIDKRG
jgi:hypothetical protein